MLDIQLNETIRSVTAFAPATLSNLAVGFDTLGLAVDRIGDTVTLTKRDDARICLSHIESMDELPYDITRNTATIALQSLLSQINIKSGFDVHLSKGIPCGSGMGGSAASAVAALTAMNAFLKKPLPLSELLMHAVESERSLSGAAHQDNAAPCFYGGLVLCHSQGIISLPPPKGCLIITKPNTVIETKKARECLPKTVTLQSAMEYSHNLGAWIAQLYKNDDQSAAKIMHDNLIEPSRMALWPNYAGIKAVAQKSGALATFMSGSGPAIASWTTEQQSGKVRKAIETYCEDQNIEINLITSSWNAEGATIKEVQTCTL